MSLDYVSGTLETTIRSMAKSPESIIYRGALALNSLRLLNQADFPEGECRKAYLELKGITAGIEIVNGEGFLAAAARELTRGEAEGVAVMFVQLADLVNAATPISV